MSSAFASIRRSQRASDLGHEALGVSCHDILIVAQLSPRPQHARARKPAPKFKLNYITWPLWKHKSAKQGENSVDRQLCSLAQT
jgi:hypothetical protein